MSDIFAVKMDCTTNKTPPKTTEASGGDTNLSAVVTPILRAKRSISGASGLVMDPRTPNMSSPPAKRFHRVRNPFEAATADRLHLPMIASPSLFQRPATPQFSSTQFEWTIDEVSSLRPVHLEPHETQFQDSPDPEFEAKAQSAISSYFKDQVIVPSPVDCPLRKQRIVMSERNGQTPIAKSKLRQNMRDCAVQTVLSLPVILPPALEEALRPYFQPQLAMCSSTLAGANHSDGSMEANNMSLRRKLFDIHNVILLDGQKANDTDTPMQSQNASSPVSPLPIPRIQIMGKLSDSCDKSSFGSLSPISNRGGISFTSHSSDDGIAAKVSRRDEFMQEIELLSPIEFNGKPKNEATKPMRRSRSLGKLSYRSQCDTTDGLSMMDDVSPKRSPEAVLSPMRALSLSPTRESSFGGVVSELVSSFERATTASYSEGKVKPTSSLKDDEDTVDINDLEDDEMQVTYLSQQSFDCSTSTINSDTPRSSGRRSAIRKNLSQSMTSTNWFDLELHANDAAQQEPGVADRKPYEENGDSNPARTPKRADENADSLSPVKRLVFYRTDSGFNEMTTSTAIPVGGLNMGCCSTPSKRSSK